jgi:hypothetical protein
MDEIVTSGLQRTTLLTDCSIWVDENMLGFGCDAARMISFA